MKDKRKERFIIAGLGNRGRDSFAKALLAFPQHGYPEFKERAEIVAFVDTNKERAKVANEVLGTDIPVYATIEQAVADHPADWCIITTPDYTHADVGVAALDKGLNLVLDKPMATSVWECNRIIEAGKRNDKHVIVGHNLRYDEHMITMAKLIWSGVIGDIQQVESAEILNFDHGGSYFHRWHSEFDKSAGLMTHKCCHQLDIINWVLNDEPIGVAALGARTFYVPRPELNHGTRCSECPITAECPHFCDIDAHDQRYRKMYVNVENVDGYIRDSCVFSDRNTINDREVLNILYARGTTCSFSLITYAPREYNYYYFTGTKGRIEYRVTFDPQDQDSADTKGMAETGMALQSGKRQIQIFHANGSVEDVPVKKLHEGYGHGGADVKLIGSLLNVKVDGIDPAQLATPEQARNAVAIADMSARSIAAGGRFVGIDETGRDFPPAPPKSG